MFSPPQIKTKHKFMLYLVDQSCPHALSSLREENQDLSRRVQGEKGVSQVGHTGIFRQKFFLIEELAAHRAC